MNISCPLCEGRRPFCIHRSYPLPRIDDMRKKIQPLLSEHLFGPATSVFVGREGYPNVFAGPMVSLVGPQPEGQWFGQTYQQIIEARSLVVRSSRQENIFSRSRFVEDNQLLALASKPADTEVTFAKKPFYRFFLSDYLQPMGPSGQLKKMVITENVRVPAAVETIVRDELTATEAAFALYNKEQDVYKITTIFSSGILGADQRKKLVPTRWSITATDDIIAKTMMETIREAPHLSDVLVFEAKYMDNHFCILLIPGSWEYENFEIWSPGSNWAAKAGPDLVTPDSPANTHGSWVAPSKIIEEHEPFEGRTSYAESQAGGYYAARLAAVEYLHKTRKQAKVVSFREIYEGYQIPLGVWVVRETARAAMRQPPHRFSTLPEALAYVDSRNRIPVAAYRQKSRILGRRTLRDFIH